MKKVVLKLAMADDKDKKKVMKIVSGIEGVDSVAIDMKDKKLTVTGDIDPVNLVSKLRKICSTDIVSVGPAKEEQKKKEEPAKKDDGKKDTPPAGDNKKKDNKDHQENKIFPMPLPYYPPPPPPHYYPQHMPYYNRSVEEDPNGCVIC